MGPEKDMGAAQVVEDVKVSVEQILALNTALKESEVELANFLAKADIGGLDELNAADAPNAIKWIRAQKAKK